MTALLGLVCLAGLVGLIAGVVAVFRPLPKLHLTNRRRAAFVVAGSLVTLVVAGSLVPPESATPSENRPAHEAAAPPKPAPYIIGQPLDIGDFRVIVRSVEERDAVGHSIVQEQASTGGVLVVVEYTIENIADRPKAAYELPKPSLIGPNGVAYERDVAKTAAYASEGELNSKVMSDLNPGIQVKNALVYEVSKASFDRNSWMVGLGSGGRLRVDIRPDAFPEVPHQNLGDCSELEAVGDRELCRNPDLLRRSEIVVARVMRHQKLHPDDEILEIKAAFEPIWKCEDRACLLAPMNEIERLTKNWPIG